MPPDGVDYLVIGKIHVVLWKWCAVVKCLPDIPPCRPVSTVLHEWLIDITIQRHFPRTTTWIWAAITTDCNADVGWKLIWNSVTTHCIYINAQVTWLPSPRSKAQALVCLPVCGAPWWVLLQHSIMIAIIFHCWVWYCVLSLHVLAKIEVRASSLSLRLPLCQICFLSRPALLS